MWTDLVQAYESKLAVLEEARRAYSKAVSEVMDHVGPALEAGVRKGVGVGAEHRIESVPGLSNEDAVFASAPWSHVSIVDDSSATEIWISGWIASCWGGPAGTLRIAISLEKVHNGLNRKEWIEKIASTMSDSMPGEHFDPIESDGFPDISPSWPTMRVVSIALQNQDAREAAKEAHDAAVALTEGVLPMLELIRQAILPMASAEQALLKFRPSLEARAQEDGHRVYPPKGLGPWQGGKYLQVGAFWLCADPASNTLLAVANKEDQDVLYGLADRLGCPMARRGGYPSIVLLTEEQLRDPMQDVDSLVSMAFNYWFDSKTEALASEESDIGEVDEAS